MPKITIGDIAAAGPELDEGDLRLVNGGIRPELSTNVYNYDVGACYQDPDICGPDL